MYDAAICRVILDYPTGTWSANFMEKMACIQGGKFGKLNKRVTFPEVLDMVPYMSGEGDKPPLYHLYAVVVHLDVSNASDSGHYICYIKNSLGHWYKIDDSKVKSLTGSVFGNSLSCSRCITTTKLVVVRSSWQIINKHVDNVGIIVCHR
jgi:hypothetical protein